MSNILDKTLREILAEDESAIYQFLSKRLTALDDDGQLLGIHEYCDKHGLQYDAIADWKLVSHTGTPYYNIKFKSLRGATIKLDFASKLVEYYSKQNKVKNIPLPSNKKTRSFDRLVISDAHIGMEPNKNGTHPFNAEWNESILFIRLKTLLKHVIDNKQGDVLYIDELGDFVDGLGGQTTRGGHELPQNMTDEEMFEVALKAKFYLLDALSKVYREVRFWSVSNDNHAGTFAALINNAFKIAAELKWQNVKCITQRKFIDHYLVELSDITICFINSHGKDKEILKHGFNLVPGNSEKELLQTHIRQHKLEKLADKIVFSKGDSHQYLLDYTNPTFDYCNFPSFAPPSEYLATKYGESKQGFVFFNYDETGKQITCEHWF